MQNSRRLHRAKKRFLERARFRAICVLVPRPDLKPTVALSAWSRPDTLDPIMDREGGGVLLQALAHTRRFNKRRRLGQKSSDTTIGKKAQDTNFMLITCIPIIFALAVLSYFMQ